MIDLGVAVFKQAVEVERCQRVGAFAFLLPVQQPFFKIFGARRLSKFLGKVFSRFLANVLIGFLFFFDLVALIQRP